MATASLGAVIAFVRRLSDDDPRSHTDRQLLDRFTSAHDESAFAELVRRHGPMVLAICKRVLRHQQDAEDSFQAAFLVLARKATSIRQDDSVAAWLYQVARRSALRARANGDRQPAQLPPSGSENGSAAPHDLLRVALDDELESLPEQYRSAVVLCYLEGRTQGEAAQLLATTTDAINSRLKRARELLRHRLARHGWVVSPPVIAAAWQTEAAQAALAAPLIRRTTQIACNFATQPASVCGASAAALTLAQGVMPNMIPAHLKVAFVLFLAVALLISGAWLTPPAASETPSPRDARRDVYPDVTIAPAKRHGPGKPKRSCIILWMAGGLSQMDSFDPKAGDAALFRPIDTDVKGVQFTELFPLLARQANHLAVIRSLTHRLSTHGTATQLMQTGYEPSPVQYPGLGSVLAKELGDQRPNLPRYFFLGPRSTIAGGGAGFLGARYAALGVPAHAGAAPLHFTTFLLPGVEEFESLAKGKGQTHRDAVAKAFDLAEEKADVRAAYGKTPFGQGCLLARRLVDRDVPVVELALGGWDAHANVATVMKQRSPVLDAALAELLKDLHKSRRLESTLVVCVSEFGRTPSINTSGGRDHWSQCFTAILAGAGIKGGQAIGKTSADGVTIDERPVTPPELLATIYQALGINPTNRNATPTNEQIPLVEKGTHAVKELLR